MRQRLLVVVIALAAVLAPQIAAAQSTIELVVGDIDAYWSQQFADAGVTYASPGL
ncbi:MAG: hypothetical protein K0S78_2987, partial [Thermomicrobiales bacterium]|nr:hypothetical protein [Thermomicrobiales bacterium]